MDELERLIHDLTDADWQVRRKAVKSLGRLGEKAIAPLATALSDPNELVRAAAAHSLSELPYGRAVGILARTLHDPSEWVRAAAATALGKPGNHQVVDVLIEALNDPGESVRVSAANSLGEIGNPHAVDPLMIMLRDSSDWIRMSAAHALGQVGGPKALPELRRLAREDQGLVEWLDVSEIARLAIDEIEQQIEDSQISPTEEHSSNASLIRSKQISRTVSFLESKNPSDVVDALHKFPRTYLNDWIAWRRVCSKEAIHGRIAMSSFGRILRKWQATRPLPMRRPRDEATHEQPFLEDLAAQAIPYLESLNTASVRDAVDFNSHQIEALTALWSIFRNLTVKNHASCVGITKAILLLTQGRIGPAFDATVRLSLSLSRPLTAHEWISCLQSISQDIEAFETKHGVMLEELVPVEWRPIAVGRVYDMVAGPKVR